MTQSQGPAVEPQYARTTTIRIVDDRAIRQTLQVALEGACFGVKFTVGESLQRTLEDL